MLSDARAHSQFQAISQTIGVLVAGNVLGAKTRQGNVKPPSRWLLFY